MSSRSFAFVLPLILGGLISLLHLQLTSLFQLGREFQVSGALERHTHQPPPPPQQQQQQQQQQPPPSDQTGRDRARQPRKWAYAYLMAGVDVGNPGYRGILYNVLVSAEILKGSKADVVVMVQMADSTNETRLPQSEEDLLRNMGVKVRYLDLPPRQNFYTIQYEKFHILDMVEYSRVIFLDGDVMPYCSMDYLFELSDPEDGANRTLKENLVIAWSQEPAHGGLFMLEPKEGDRQRLEDIITRRETGGASRKKKGGGSKTAFDRVTGWGHVIAAPDHWHSIGGAEGPNATLWKWHGDFADQGLLYFWTKYHKKSVSLVIKDRVENWSSRNGGEEAFLEQALPDGFLTPHACLPEQYAGAGKYAKSRYHPRYAPYRDFRHFSGRGKPWRPRNVDWNRTFTFEDVVDTDAQHYWLYMLRRLNDKLGLGLDVSNLNIPDAPYGGNPTEQMVKQVVKARRIQEHRRRRDTRA